MLVEARDNPDHRRTQPFSNKDQSKADLLLPTALYKQAPLVFTHPFGTRTASCNDTDKPESPVQEKTAGCSNIHGYLIV